MYKRPPKFIVKGLWLAYKHIKAYTIPFCEEYTGDTSGRIDCSIDRRGFEGLRVKVGNELGTDSLNEKCDVNRWRDAKEQAAFGLNELFLQIWTRIPT